jgi:hypothetical protein
MIKKMEQVKATIFAEMTTGAPYFPAPQVKYLTVTVSEKQEIEGCTEYVVKFIYQRRVCTSRYWLDDQFGTVQAKVEYV